MGRHDLQRKVTAALVERIVEGPGCDEIETALVARAIVDTAAVMIAGAAQPAAAGVRAALSAPAGESFVVGANSRTSPDHAALLNGTAAHALDFDDVSHSVKGHPSTVLLPALLGVVDAVAPSGQALADAYGAGLDVGAALWSGLGPDHYARGWHATATVGVVAATAAVARLWGLPGGHVRNALGIAASSASGLRQNFGTDTKVLHAGVAAQGAVRACMLASHGVTADPDAIDGTLGMLRVLGIGDIEAAHHSLAGPSVLSGGRGLNVKRYPCCYFAHRAIDAVLEMPAVEPNDVLAVDVTVSPGSLSALKYDTPTTGLEGKFSGPYVIAAAMVRRDLVLDDFTNDAVARPEVQALAGRISWREAAEPSFGETHWVDGYAVVRVTHRDGRIDERRVDVPRGHARNPLDDNLIEAKFLSCTTAVLGRDRAARAARRLRTITSADDASTWNVDLDNHNPLPKEN
ncbi:UNVERIFIED_ORG: 2-methylcitrate dehydratase PrpD [Gordonia westfalica J30]